MLRRGMKNADDKGKMKMQLRGYAAMAVILCGLAGMGQVTLCVNAAPAETVQQGTVMKAKERIEMKAEPDKTAETLMTFQVDDLVFTVGAAEGGWYRVIYQGNEGYVEQDGLAEVEVDVEGLDAEMAAGAEETKFVVETVEKYRADARRSKIWGTVIIVLVAGIFGVGIFSAVRSGKNEETDSGKQQAGKSERSNSEKGGRKNEDRGNNTFGKERRKEKAKSIEIEDLN